MEIVNLTLYYFIISHKNIFVIPEILQFPKLSCLNLKKTTISFLSLIFPKQAIKQPFHFQTIQGIFFLEITNPQHFITYNFLKYMEQQLNNMCTTILRFLKIKLRLQQNFENYVFTFKLEIIESRMQFKKNIYPKL